MTLLSHKLFDHCDISLETSESSTEMVEALHVNPSSGLPLMKNSSIDIGGYVIGDGPMSNDDETGVSVADDCSVSVDSQIEPTCIFETSGVFDDDFSISNDFGCFNDDWL
ncbi:conserved hypothetical protein [Alteromonas macleodii]|jgi:hypothetical protein